MDHQRGLPGFRPITASNHAVSRGATRSRVDPVRMRHRADPGALGARAARRSPFSPARAEAVFAAGVLVPRVQRGHGQARRLGRKGSATSSTRSSNSNAPHSSLARPSTSTATKPPDTDAWSPGLSSHGDQAGGRRHRRCGSLRASRSDPERTRDPGLRQQLRLAPPHDVVLQRARARRRRARPPFVGAQASLLPRRQSRNARHQAGRLAEQAEQPEPAAGGGTWNPCCWTSPVIVDHRRPCPATTEAARHATRASSTRPTHRRSRRSSR